jgi:hypothetical protein
MKPNCGCLRRTDLIAFGQKGSALMPQVRSNDLGQDEHRHIAADAVALPGDRFQLADHRLLQVRVAVIELQRVGPAIEVRVATVGEHHRAALRLHAAIVLRCARQIALAAVDEVLRVLFGPCVIRSHVVRHEVEHQLQSALLQPMPQAR